MAATKPQILLPGELSPESRPAPGTRSELQERHGGAGGLFRDENLDTLSRVLDTWFLIPGTRIRFGIDGILGFIPGLGDIAGGLASCVIILAAYFRGAALVTIARMVLNVAIEVIVGAVPLLGNLFDIGFRANRRNYHLLERSLATGRRDTWKDWLFMAALGTCLILLALLPVFLLWWVLHALFGASLRWL